MENFRKQACTHVERPHVQPVVRLFPDVEPQNHEPVCRADVAASLPVFAFLLRKQRFVVAFTVFAEAKALAPPPPPGLQDRRVRRGEAQVAGSKKVLKNRGRKVARRRAFCAQAPRHHLQSQEEEGNNAIGQIPNTH